MRPYVKSIVTNFEPFLEKVFFFILINDRKSVTHCMKVADRLELITSVRYFLFIHVLYFIWYLYLLDGNFAHTHTSTCSSLHTRLIIFHQIYSISLMWTTHFNKQILCDGRWGESHHMPVSYAFCSSHQTIASKGSDKRYCSPTQCNVTQNGSARTFRIPNCSACIGISQDLD